jgi:hypothetical protein
MKLRRLIFSTILCFTLTAVLVAAEQEDQDNSFTGTVVERTKDHLKVSRVLSGKTEERVFLISAQTKVDGSLRARVRVNVRYVSGPDGDTATLVIVRTEPAKQKGK